MSEEGHMQQALKSEATHASYANPIGELSMLAGFWEHQNWNLYNFAWIQFLSATLVLLGILYITHK